MATAGTVNGRVVKIYTGALPGTAITCLTNSTLTKSLATRDTSCKDTSGNWANNIAGQQSWTLSGEGNFAFDSANGAVQLDAIFDDATSVVVSIAGVSGDKRWYGNALLTELSFAFPDNENSTFSFTFTGTGALTQASIS